MDYSELKGTVYAYLGCADKAGSLDDDIDKCISEIEKADSFACIYAEYTEPLEFLKSEPYEKFLCGSDGYFLIAATLGISVDKMIRRASASDIALASVLDATASAYLEYKTEEQKRVLYPALSYTFCPGYQGTSAEDIRIFFKELRPERIGMSLTDSGMMIPQKSIVGIAAKNGSPFIECSVCEARINCKFGKDGGKCKASER